ncbi:type I restriction enzyme HsdR N-terminal domain-containing protein [Rhizobium leguminosarum]|uniref:type I restriction enzyme HsdR N-terminal domain-containing protein n=1 Tax=Rhizobium leguminosarum TaxID=384 RepID=UPI001C9851E8|nr:type I restriction enzyme HsdR N-terminal domain-containing protein [Rhizobium leguminosarum]MBY5725227.1 hypothetical protein [Rhizobium leguminosarum]
MFVDFDSSLLDDLEFKEDSVREVIIVPMLTRLGYAPSGEHRVVRSKILTHPFIYAGTRKLPIKLIPDYTLTSGGKVILVLDAKGPKEDVLSREAVQQVYSYAIHPEVKSQHFALCNGKRLVVFSVDQSDPILSVDYAGFVPRWEEIERFLSPRTLREPSLRRFAPDFGCALSRLGLSEGAEVVLMPAGINLVGRLDDRLMTAGANVEFAGKQHCVSFDFDRRFLPAMLSGLPNELASAFANALERAPFQAAAELVIELDLRTALGAEILGEKESFRPLIIKEVLVSRFNPMPMIEEQSNFPPNLFRLRKAFTVSK